ncbi:hypothetical protein [Flavobacterium sp.]|uniref:hypothetical protein n=1 Tax=Flavobacterium sp. TaxID=239 RepID=UPI0039E51146
MKKPLQQVQKEYEDFINHLPDYINQLKSYFKTDTFHYGLSEIEQVEKFLKKHKKKSASLGLTPEQLDTMVVAYLGVAWLWHFGGQWFMVKHQSASEYGVPLLAGFGGKEYRGVAINPSGWVSMSRENQLDKPISAIYKNYIWFFENHPQYPLEPIRNIQ